MSHRAAPTIAAMQLRMTTRRKLGAGAGVAVIVAGAALAFTVGPFGQRAGADSPTRSTSPVALASPSPTAAPTDTVGPTDTPSPTPTATPAPPYPTMLAAIGDSYTKAWNVSPLLAHWQDHPIYSWVVGTAKKDGVFSLRERFEALGVPIRVVDASRTGKLMNDARRQARIVVDAAKKLPAGSTVYVTFEMGTNDVCYPRLTPAGTFEQKLDDALSVLRQGLPAGSRILMLSIPDFDHLRAITQANAAARNYFLRGNGQCAPWLGSDTTTTLAQASKMMGIYNDKLVQACNEIEATDGPSNKLHCTSNRDGLAEKDFTIADLSTIDYFHPSFSGQGKMAEAAWRLGDWGMVPLPAGAAAFAPEGGRAEPAAIAGLPVVGLSLEPQPQRRLAARPRPC